MVAAFLGISGVAAIVFGLLYLRISHALPHLARGHAAAGRAHLCLMAGSACVVVAWLLRKRRRGAG
jgi:hypothetical protein